MLEADKLSMHVVVIFFQQMKEISVASLILPPVLRGRQYVKDLLKVPPQREGNRRLCEVCL